MRLSTANYFDTSITTLQGRQLQLQKTQIQLSSGSKIQQASDDPTAAAQAERARASISRIDANTRAVQASQNSMTLAESALGDATDLMQQIRETVVQSGDGSYTDAERQALAAKVQDLRNQLFTVANRTDGAGNYLFSGQGSGGPPFLDQAGGVVYAGVSGSNQTGVLGNYQLSVDGRSAFEQALGGNGSFITSAGTNVNTGEAPSGWIDSGNVTSPSSLTGHNYQIQINGTSPDQNYVVTDTDTGSVVGSDSFSPGQSLQFDGMSMAISGSPADGDQFSVAPAGNDLKLFDVLDRTIADLKAPSRTGAQISQANASDLRDLDAVMGNVQNVRSQVGQTMNNLDNTTSQMASLKLNAQTEQSGAEDLDMVQGISDFQNQQTGYQAALQTYAMVQRMSLLQYITS
ncbi:MAG TPA: flagellar hook-associated protein FlgL [Burkholderiaceae bacterium]|jgi:flagellar hook-associated protein 3 FlgL